MKVQIEVDDLGEFGFRLKLNNHGAGYIIPREFCTVLTEGEKEETKNEYARQLKLLSELKNTISPLVEALNKSKALPNEIPAPEPELGDIKALQELRNSMDKTEPVLIAKAGEKVRIVDIGKYKGEAYRLNKEYILDSDLYSNGSFYAKGFMGICGLTDDMTKTMKFEKIPVTIEEHKEESEHIPFDLEKWKTGKFDVVQRNGLPAEILKTDLKADEMLVVVFHQILGGQYVDQVLGTGKRFIAVNDESDLFLIPKTETVWRNEFKSVHEYGSQEEAKIYANSFPGYEFIRTIEVKRPIK